MSEHVLTWGSTYSETDPDRTRSAHAYCSCGAVGESGSIRGFEFEESFKCQSWAQSWHTWHLLDMQAREGGKGSFNVADSDFTPGLSLLDRCAMEVMRSLLRSERGAWVSGSLAQTAYSHAEAMMAQRQRVRDEKLKAHLAQWPEEQPA